MRTTVLLALDTLVIGNSNYVEFGSLSNPKNDAQGIDRALRASPAVRGRATARHCCFASVLRSSGLTHDVFIDQQPIRKRISASGNKKNFPMVRNGTDGSHGCHDGLWRLRL